MRGIRSYEKMQIVNGARDDRSGNGTDRDGDVDERFTIDADTY